MILLIFAAAIALVLYLCITHPFSHWKKLNIPHVSPHILWGNLKDAVYQRKPFFQLYETIYRKFPDSPYVGIYIIRRPGLLIREPSLIKDIVLNNFSSFHDNDFKMDEVKDPIFGRNPFTTSGDKWKQRRATHTAQFSSGKIKYMFNQLEQGGDRMVKFLDDKIDKNGKFTMIAIELVGKYTLYNVGNVTMGIDPKTFEDDNAGLIQMANKIIEPNFYNALRQLLIFLTPSLANFLGVCLVPDEVTSQFRKLAQENLEYRKQNNIVRNDFFESIQEYKGEKCSVEEMIVQIGGLFLDGFGTSSSIINFILYALATHPDVQATLRKEVDEYLSKHNNRIPYEAIQEMQYLDAVIAEGLRKYPPFASVTKICTKTYTFPPVNDSAPPLTIEPDTPVVISISSLHYDEKYFPEPQNFDPTRFLGENKENIVKFTYLPFNDGPRACLGKRYGLLQAKVMLYKLVSEFEFRLNPKTVTPIEYDGQSVILAARDDIWLDFYRRNK